MLNLKVDPKKFQLIYDVDTLPLAYRDLESKNVSAINPESPRRNISFMSVGMVNETYLSLLRVAKEYKDYSKHLTKQVETLDYNTSIVPLAEGIISCLEGNILALERDINDDLIDSPYQFGFGVLLQEGVFNVGMSVSESTYPYEEDDKIRWYFPLETVKTEDLTDLEERAKRDFISHQKYATKQLEFYEKLISGLKEELSILEA